MTMWRSQVLNSTTPHFSPLILHRCPYFLFLLAKFFNLSLLYSYQGLLKGHFFPASRVLHVWCDSWPDGEFGQISPI